MEILAQVMPQEMLKRRMLAVSRRLRPVDLVANSRGLLPLHDVRGSDVGVRITCLLFVDEWVFPPPAVRSVSHDITGEGHDFS